MPRVAPSNAWTFGDWADLRLPGGGYQVGVVRCPEDGNKFRELAARVLSGEGIDATPQPPQWAWFRWIPTPHGEFSKVIAPQDRPGHGVWRGSYVIYQPE